MFRRGGCSASWLASAFEDTSQHKRGVLSLSTGPAALPTPTSTRGLGDSKPRNVRAVGDPPPSDDTATSIGDRGQPSPSVPWVYGLPSGTSRLSKSAGGGHAIET